LHSIDTIFYICISTWNPIGTIIGKALAEADYKHLELVLEPRLL